MRLNKFLAENLGLSRREADEIISKGMIFVDGKVARLGQPVEESSDIVYDGKIIKRLKSYTYLMLNKPTGYVSSRKRQGDSPTLYELLPEKYKTLKTVGRLDKDSSGLILLTNDGDFAFRMTHPKFKKEKIYEVELDHPLAPLHHQMIADFGVNLKDGNSKFALEPLDESKKYWRVYLHEGRNRQIRRTFGAIGYTVLRLHRTNFGPYNLGNLTPKKFREITLS